MKGILFNIAHNFDEMSFDKPSYIYDEPSVMSRPVMKRPRISGVPEQIPWQKYIRPGSQMRQ